MSQNITQQAAPAMPAAAQLFDMLFGFMIAQAVAVAARLGIADLLKDESRSVDELAQATKTHPRALYRLLRAVASVGVFAEDEAGRFRMTPLAEPLRSDAPDSMRAFMAFWGADWHWQVWGNLADSVRTGQPAFEQMYGQAFFDHLPQHPEKAQVFNDAMTSLSAQVSAAVVETYDFSGINKLVDVGGGHGYLLAAILEKYPQMSGVVGDMPMLTDDAQALLRARGLSHRCEAVGIDFFKSAPPDGDAYIMKHIIHDWDDERATTILRNCHQAMTKNGKLLVVEMVIPEGNAPAPGKFLDLEMLLFLHSFERTEAEYRALFEQAGFQLTRIVPTPSPYSVIEGLRM